MQYVVYLIHSADGILLYVGASGAFEKRKEAHAYSGKFAEYPGFVFSILSHHATREEVFAAESAAIESMRPLLNGSPGRPKGEETKVLGIRIDAELAARFRAKVPPKERRAIVERWILETPAGWRP